MGAASMKSCIRVVFCDLVDIFTQIYGLLFKISCFVVQMKWTEAEAFSFHISPFHILSSKNVPVLPEKKMNGGFVQRNLVSKALVFSSVCGSNCYQKEMIEKHSVFVFSFFG